MYGVLEAKYRKSDINYIWFAIVLKMRDVCFISRDAGHLGLIKMRDCPVGCGMVDSFANDIRRKPELSFTEHTTSPSRC